MTTCTQRPRQRKRCRSPCIIAVRLSLIGNESAPIQLEQCRFPGLAISNSKMLIYFSNKIYGSNFIKQHSETVMVWNYQNADGSLRKNVIVSFIIIFVFRSLLCRWCHWVQGAQLPQRESRELAVSRHLVNCCTTVETSFTTNLRQIEVMESQHYSRPTWHKLYASSHDASTVVGVVNKLSRRRVLLTTRSNFRGEIF